MTRAGLRSARLRALCVATVTLGVTGGLSACGGSSTTAGTSSPSASPVVTPTQKSTAVLSAKVLPGTTKGYVGAMKDVTGFTCEQVDEVWKVAGAVTNPSQAAADYRVYTVFLDKQRDTRGLLEVDVTGVAPREKRQWSSQLRLAESGLDCVLRVERNVAR